MLKYELGSYRDGLIRYQSVIFPEQAERLHGLGRSLRYIEGIEAWHEANHGFHPEEIGARPLFESGD